MPPLIKGKVLTTPIKFPIIAQVKSEKQSDLEIIGNAILDTIPKVQAPHLVIKARAGCGKTWTIIETIKTLFGLSKGVVPSEQQRAIFDATDIGPKPKTVVVCSFSNAIVDELKDRVPQGVGCQAKGLHSMGYYAIRKAFNITGNPSDNRVDEIIAQIVGIDLRVLRKEKPILRRATKELVGLCKQNLVSFPTLRCDTGVLFTAEENRQLNDAFDKLDDLVRYYEVDCGSLKQDIYSLVPRVLERCKEVDKDGYVDFNDMIWLPVVLKLPMWINDLVLIDEAQDLCRAQQALTKMIARRLIYVGDEKQAIFAFAGADSQSLTRLKEELSKTARGCIELGLTVTRRCGKRIVKEANRYVPDFEAHPDNPEGEVDYALYPIQRRRGPDGKRESYEIPYSDSYLPMVSDGDMVLCRSNAPLVNQCLRLLKLGRKAFIRGRNIADQLLALIDKLVGEKANVPDLLRNLNDWVHTEVDKENAERSPSENKIQSIADKADCIKAFSDGKTRVDEVKQRINTIFTDSRDKGICFSSIHKAKGLESDTVFYITGFGPNPEKLSNWQREQEDNLAYVAITRAKTKLVYVGQDDRIREEEDGEDSDPRDESEKAFDDADEASKLEEELLLHKEEYEELENGPRGEVAIDLKDYIDSWLEELYEAMEQIILPEQVREGIRELCETYIQGEEP